MYSAGKDKKGSTHNSKNPSEKNNNFPRTCAIQLNKVPPAVDKKTVKMAINGEKNHDIEDLFTREALL